ncbi:MAG: 3'-5' exoribonuclease [Clostridia bacterium]|nr:3'-5' exoribonuclease [Clostridia bacterium]
MNLRQTLEKEGYTQDKVKIEDVQYDKQKNTCDLCFVYAEWNILNDEQKAQIVDICHLVMSDVANINVKFKGAYVDKDILYGLFVQFLDKHYKALKGVFDADNVLFSKQDKTITITLKTDKITADMLKTGTFVQELSRFMKDECFYNFDIVIDGSLVCDPSVLNNRPTTGSTLAWALDQEKQLNKLIVSDVEYLMGKPIEDAPQFILTAKEHDGEDMTLCGVVSFFTESTYKKKSRNPEIEPVDAVRFSFNLTDASGFIRVVMFPNEKDANKLRLIKDGQELIISGTISNYNDQLSFRGRSVSTCKIVSNEIHYCYRSANDKYNVVSPLPWVEVTQMDLFSMIENNVSDYLKNNTIVMFDLETTGLDPDRCTITEIGAVKIKNGKCVETFQTLVNPQMPIPREVVEKTHITDEMVKSAPTIDQVMPDFYKFADGCILSAYNISFDYAFLKNIGHKLRFKFENEQIDCLDVVRRKVASLSNYKLATVSKALNIELKNAHRALADALAAAKVFIKLM